MLTAAHVVGDNSQVKVKMASGKTPYGPVLRTDDAYDLALVLPGERAQAWLSVSYREDYNFGKEVLAMGFAFGGPEITVVKGSITSIRKTEGDSIYLQTDAALNPGTSGAPFITSDRQVVGLVQSTFRETLEGFNVKGVNFAPSSKDIRAWLATVF